MGSFGTEIPANDPQGDLSGLPVFGNGLDYPDRMSATWSRPVNDSPDLKVRSWPGAVLRLPGFDRQLTQHSRRSTTRAWLACVDHGSLHSTDMRIPVAGFSRTSSELFDGRRLTTRLYSHARIKEKLDSTLKERANLFPSKG